MWQLVHEYSEKLASNAINQSIKFYYCVTSITYRQLKRVYETLPKNNNNNNNKINEDKLRGKSEHREELESERGHNSVGVPAGRQAFPWHPSRSTMPELLKPAKERATSTLGGDINKLKLLKRDD